MAERSKRVAGLAGAALVTKFAEPLLAALAWTMSPVGCAWLCFLGAVLVVASCWERKGAC